MKTLQARVVVLTGAAGGIGSAIARSLANDGAHLALVDRDEQGLTALAGSLPHPNRVSQHVVDLLQFESFPALVDDIIQRHGAVHVLINNAGLTVHGTFLDQTADEIERVLTVDLRAAIHLTKLFLPHLRADAPGHVVNMASMAGFAGFPFQSTYSAAKFGLRGFGQALRPELHPLGIGVTTIMPGAIATDFLGAAGTHDKATSDQLASLMRKYGTPPTRVATKVRRAILRNHAEVRVGWDAHLVCWTQWVCPPLIPFAMRMAYRRGVLGAKTS